MTTPASKIETLRSGYGRGDIRQMQRGYNKKQGRRKKKERTKKRVEKRRPNKKKGGEKVFLGFLRPDRNHSRMYCDVILFPCKKATMYSTHVPVVEALLS